MPKPAVPCQHGARCKADCLACDRARRKQRYKVHGAACRAYRHRYEKSPNGFLMRAYRNMQSRVTGVQKESAHLYKGLSILSRDAFYEWARNSREFWVLYRAWLESGFERRLTPSVNRIRTNRGYTLDNMEWLTHSVNSGLANQNRPLRAELERVYASIV